MLFRIVNIDFDEPDALIEAADSREAALRWGNTRGDAWWDALPWNGESRSDFRAVCVFVYPPESADEFVVVRDRGVIRVAMAP